MTTNVNSDSILALLECISESITEGIRKYRASLNGQAAPVPDAAEAVTAEIVEKTVEKAAKKAPLTVAKLTAKILRAADGPLKKTQILDIARSRYKTEINATTLSMVLNRAIKSGKGIKRVSHGLYTNFSRKLDVPELTEDADVMEQAEN